MGWPRTHREVWNERNTDRPTSVYCVYDGADLIYVGMARDVGQRWTQHRNDKPWWDDGLVTTSTEFPTRDMAALEEQRLVAAHPALLNQVRPGPASGYRRGQVAR